MLSTGGVDNARVETASFFSVELTQIAQRSRYYVRTDILQHIFVASLVTVSLGGVALLTPGVAFAERPQAQDEHTTAVLGPEEDYQHGLTVNGVSPTLRTVVVEDEFMLAYCIEFFIRAAAPDHASAVTGWDDFTGDNNFRTDPQVRRHVAWILRHSHPTLNLEELAAMAGVKNLTEAEAVAATQSAIWHFTDDFVQDGELTVRSAADNTTAVSARAVQNVQAVFDYLTGGRNLGLDEQAVQANVTLVNATDEQLGPPATVEQLVENAEDHVFGPVQLNASTSQVDLEITSTDAAVELDELSFLDADGEVLDTGQPTTTEEIWVHVPAVTETGGVHIAAESAEFGYTGRLITPEPDEQRRFQTIVVVDKTSHQATTELGLTWTKPQGEVPSTPIEPATKPSTPPEPTPPEEVGEPETVVVVESPDESPEVEEAPQQQEGPVEQSPTEDVEQVHAADELAETGAYETRNILVALATMAVGVALLVLNRFLRRKA